MSHDDGEVPDYMRRLSIPVNAEIVEALQVGDKVEVTLIGKVSGLTNVQNHGSPERYELSVEIDAVEAYKANHDAMSTRHPQDMEPGEYRRFREAGGGK